MGHKGWWRLQGQAKVRYILLWPNLVGSLLAPTTAKYGAEKKALAAASVVILILINFPFQSQLRRKVI